MSMRFGTSEPDRTKFAGGVSAQPAGATGPADVAARCDIIFLSLPDARAVSAVVLMPLAYFKRQTATRLASHALRGDSTLSAIGATTAILALVGLVLFDAFGWWWADRGVALVIAVVAVIEARTLLTAEHAGD